MKDLLRTFLHVIGSLETGAEPVSSAMCAFSDIRYENYLPQLMFTASTMILFITAVKKKNIELDKLFKAVHALKSDLPAGVGI